MLTDGITCNDIGDSSLALSNSKGEWCGVDESMEGWYTDPFGRHEVRWMLQGIPTRLVRDGSVEGSDPVTDEPFIVTPSGLKDILSLALGSTSLITPSESLPF